MNIKLEPSATTSSSLHLTSASSANEANTISNGDQNRIAAVAAAAVAAAAVVAYNNQHHEQQQVKCLNKSTEINNSTQSSSIMSSHQHLLQHLTSSSQHQHMRNFNLLNQTYNYSHTSEQSEYNSNHLLVKSNSNKLEKTLNTYQTYVNNIDEFYDDDPKTENISNSASHILNNNKNYQSSKNDDSLIDNIGDVEESDDAIYNETDRNKNVTNDDDDLIDNDNENLDEEDFDETGKFS